MSSAGDLGRLINRRGFGAGQRGAGITAIGGGQARAALCCRRQESRAQKSISCQCARRALRRCRARLRRRSGISLAAAFAGRYDSAPRKGAVHLIGVVRHSAAEEQVASLAAAAEAAAAASD